MDSRRIVDKLEHDLSHFLINESCKDNPELRGTPEMYKYKGLSIYPHDQSNSSEKSISVRIGALEAEFKIDTCDKNSGSLAPEDERLIMIWMGQNENAYQLKSIFYKQKATKQIAIVPFDLEELFTQN